MAGGEGRREGRRGEEEGGRGGGREGRGEIKTRLDVFVNFCG